jgi:ABC-2 type transport system ATP-binding protein
LWEIALLPAASKTVSHGDEVLQLKGVTKRFREVLALDDVTLGIRKGEVFGYIGPNGAGKTTTIKIMVGLIRDFTGGAIVDGHPIREDVAAVQKILGYLPQKAAFQEWRTVDQALVTFGRLSGMSSADVANRIPKVLELLGIPETRNRKIVHLSGGTVQKVGMAQAILHEPHLLVLDEPMTGLDPSSRYRFKEIFKELRDQGTTIFFSSHILGDVQDVADRVGILDRGRILHLGTFEQLQALMKVPKEVEVVLSRSWDKELAPALLKRLTSLERLASARFMAHVKPEEDLDEIIEALIDGIRRSGGRIRSIRPVVPDLEELYVRFVGGGGT